MHCEELIFHAQAHSHGQLTWWRSLAITRHLDDCPNCRGSYQQVLDRQTVLTNKCQESAPATLEARIFEAIASPVTLDPDNSW